MVKWILAIDRVVTNAVWAIAAVLLASISVLGLYQVLIRFVFNQPSPWTEEVIGRLLIWTVALGVVAAFREAGKAGAAAQRKKVNDDERDGIAQLRAGGMEVVTNVDGTAFRNAMTPVWSEFAKQYGADNIKRIQDVR